MSGLSVETDGFSFTFDTLLYAQLIDLQEKVSEWLTVYWTTMCLIYTLLCSSVIKRFQFLISTSHLLYRLQPFRSHDDFNKKVANRKEISLQIAVYKL